MEHQVLAPDEAVARLAQTAIPVASGVLVDDIERIDAAAEGLDAEAFVVKAAGLNHKSDRGGVVVDLRSPAAVRAAGQHLLSQLGPAALPFLVQEQHHGLELLVGLRRDPKLGASVLVGRGGTTAELEQDLSYAVAPLDPEGAHKLLRRLRLWPVLEGYRGEPGVDVEGLVAVIVAVSELATSDTDVVELDLNPVMAGQAGVVAVDVRVVVETASSQVSAYPATVDLTRMMSPRHIAVVGVSDDEHKTGSRLFRYLSSHGFEGRLDAVHPAGGSIDGRPRSRSVRELDGSPDLVCVAVPASTVPQVFRDCAAVNAGGVIVHSSGFAETRDEGRALQELVASLARETGTPLLGPNSMGLVLPEIGVTASISGGLEHQPLPGSTALLSGSGALGSCVATRLMGDGVGLSAWIHVGNEAQTGVAEYLDWMVRDPRTNAIGLLLEDIADGAALIAAGQHARASGCPILAYDLVRSEQSRAAALSHSGALLGPLELRRSVLEAAGIATTSSLQILEDGLRLLAAESPPRGRRLAVVTFSGGACSIITHEAITHDVALPELPPQTAQRIQEHVPTYAAVRNPLDVSYELITRPDDFEAVLRALTTSDAYDALLVQFTTNADPYAERTAAATIRVRDDAAIPVYVSRFGADHLAPLARARYRDAGVNLLDAPDRAVRAIAAVMDAVSPPPEPIATGSTTP